MVPGRSGPGVLRARLALERLGQLDARGAGPEALEVVELAHGHVEDVDDDVAVVHQHPLAALHPLERDRFRTLAPDLLLDRFGDRLDLRVRSAAADDEVVRDRGLAADLEHHQVVRLPVEGRAGTGERPIPAGQPRQRGESSVRYRPRSAMYASTARGTRNLMERRDATRDRRAVAEMSRAVIRWRVSTCPDS